MMNFSEPDRERRGENPRLAELFPAGDYGFQMRMRRRSVEEFFRLSPQSSAILRERRHWIEQQREACLAVLPGIEPAIDEAWRLLAEAGVSGESCLVPASTDRRLEELAGRLEPDLLFLRPDNSGEFRLFAGCVCFPSSWSLREKIGQPLIAIHAPVPTLNAKLGGSISQFLQRMVPGAAWCRENWGLSASAQLNQHPARRLPRLTASVGVDEVWLRVERQALVALPKTGGILFAIRIELFPLSSVLSDPDACSGLQRSLETMPEDVAEYKGLSEARHQILTLLG